MNPVDFPGPLAGTDMCLLENKPKSLIELGYPEFPFPLFNWEKLCKRIFVARKETVSAEERRSNLGDKN